MKKNKGINAKAWFYSQSFVSSALGLDLSQSFQEEQKQRMAELKAELAKLEAKDSMEPQQ